MKTRIEKLLSRKYGKKALLIYLSWCIVKGIIFLFMGYKLFG